MPRAIAPRTGAPEVTLAEEQEEYMPLTVAVYEDTELKTPVMLTRWTLTTEERLAIANGEDIFIAELTFGSPFTPLQVTIGPKYFQLENST